MLESFLILEKKKVKFDEKYKILRFYGKDLRDYDFSECYVDYSNHCSVYTPAEQNKQLFGYTAFFSGEIPNLTENRKS